LKSKEPQKSTETLAELFRRQVESLERAVELDPEFLEAWADLSTYHSSMYTGNWDRTPSRLDAAKLAMERAIAIDPEKPASLLARGYYYYYGFRDYDRALVDFEAALAAVPNDVKAREAVAYIHRRQGRIDEALAELEAVLPLAPRDTNLLGNVAGIYRGKRDFDRSIELRRRMDELNPDNGWNRWSLAFDVLRKTGDVSRGLEQWRELPPDPESQSYFFGSAFLAVWDRDFAAAYEWARQIPGDLPQVQGWRRGMMTHFETLRDGPASARASLEARVAEVKARIESEPGNAGLRQGIAMVYAWLGNAEAAVREGRMAVDLTARDRWEGPKSEQALARVYAELGRTDDALDLIEKLLKMTYDDSITLVDLRLDPAWDKLRENERFRALVAG
jgi:hypothetical protein